jgi:hypothetical protein
MDFFENLHSYKTYLMENPFHKQLGIDLSEYGELQRKIERAPQLRS